MPKRRRFNPLMGYPCLTCHEVQAALRTLGFVLRNQEGGHEQWILDHPDGRRKVTVSCHNEPFCRTIMKYMVAQSKFSKRQFYDAVEGIKPT
jgi:predicted RNA binding protein YcfA (HicA-like mRNA interferase family)